MSSSGSVRLRYEKCLEVWGNAIQQDLPRHGDYFTKDDWIADKSSYRDQKTGGAQAYYSHDGSD
jgi:hypothetical protein